MLTTRNPVDFRYTRAEQEAIFRYAREHDVETGGRYDARAAGILFWSHHWLHPTTREELETIGSFYVRWGGHAGALGDRTDEGFSLDDLMTELGRMVRRTWAT
jgi:hypothetical protein